MGWQAIMGAAAPLVGSIADIAMANTNRKNQEEQNRKDREFTERMWHQNNAYNTPAAQMARLKGSGLNPHTMAGQPVTASSTPALQKSTPLPDKPQLGENLGKAAASYLEVQSQTMSNDLVAANTKKAEQEIKNLEAQEDQTRQQTSSNATNEVRNRAQIFYDQMREARASGDYQRNIESWKSREAKMAQELKQAEELHQGNLDQQQANIGNTTANTRSTLQDVQRKIIENKNLPEETKLRIANLAQDLKSKYFSNKIALADQKNRANYMYQQQKTLLNDRQYKQLMYELEKAGLDLRERSMYIDGIKEVAKSMQK